MKILLLSNLGFERSMARMLQFLCAEKHEVLAFHDALTQARLKEISPDLVICHNYAYIIGKEIIDFMDSNIVNLHPSLLPHCRGLHPHIWSLMTCVPSGVSLHFVNEKIDQGAIIAQEQIEFDPQKETLRSSYQSLQQALEDLFIASWGDYSNWRKQAVPQSPGGSYYSKKDYQKIKHLITDWNLSIAAFIETFNEAKKSGYSA